MYGYNNMGMGWGLLIGLVIIIAVIWFFSRVHYYDYYPYHRMNRDSAINILKEKYAKGEIGKEEFEEKKKDLLK